MICQGCGKEVEPNELHTYYDCLHWIKLHPEDESKVTVKHLYYGDCLVPKETKKPLWAENKECPQCGAPSNPNIKACETGFNYCSDTCARTHVKANRPEGGY